MQEADARRILGVTEDADADAARRAYRVRLLRTHPDLSADGDATDRTVELTAAYRVVMTSIDDPPARPGPSGRPARGRRPAPGGEEGAGDPGGPVDPVRVTLVDPTTIGLDAPPDEALMILIDAAHGLGEVTYLDPAAGLIEVVVEFVDAPTSSIVLSMQGRSNGTTEVFCTVEPLSGGDAPPSDGVTALLVRTLSGNDRTG